MSSTTSTTFSSANGVLPKPTFNSTTNPAHIDNYEQIIAINILPKLKTPPKSLWAGMTPTRVYLSATVRVDGKKLPLSTRKEENRVLKKKYATARDAAARGKKIGGGKFKMNRNGFKVKYFGLEDEILVGEVGGKKA